MSTYLLAFVISDFESRKVENFSVYSPGKDINDTIYALDVGQRSLEELQKYINLPYQLQKMDFIAIDAFLMGAMENWGLITFKSVLCFIILFNYYNPTYYFSQEFHNFVSQRQTKLQKNSRNY